MFRNIHAGLGVIVAAALFGCGSSGEVNGGQQPGSNAGGSDASAGTGGSSGSGNGGTANGGGGTAAGGSSADSGSGQGGSAAGGGGQAAGGSNPGAGGASGTPNAGGAGGTGPIVDGGPTFGSTQCTDGIDNDADGLSDSKDPECTGPLDDDEGSYATGIPGDNVDDCQDCFFDGDSGQGNDGCAYPSSCFSGTDPGGAADCFNCSVSTRCVNYCKTYTPNGCDCFGCCQVTVPGGSTKTVRLSSTCSIDTINDATKCQTCVQSTDCVNKCETCELCLGKTTLPPSCTPTGAGGAANAGGTSGAGGTPAKGGTQNAGGASTGGSGTVCPTPACPAGQAPCGTSCLPDCPSGQFCLTGCCISSPA